MSLAKIFVKCIVLGSLALVCSPGYANDAEVDDESLAVVERIAGAGNATATSAGGENWNLVVGDAIAAGETITLSAGTALDLRLADGSVLRLAPGTRFTLRSFEHPAEGWMSWTFRLLEGTVSGNVRKETDLGIGKMKLKIHTPQASLGVRGTEFTFGIDATTGENVLETHSGEVLLAGAGVDLDSGKEIETVVAGQVSSVPMGAQRPLPALPAAEARQTRYQKIGGFFTRADSLRVRPLELKPRFRDMPPATREQFRQNLLQHLQERKLLQPDGRRFGGGGAAGSAAGAPGGADSRIKLLDAGGAARLRQEPFRGGRTQPVAPQAIQPQAKPPQAKQPAVQAPVTRPPVTRPPVKLPLAKPLPAQKTSSAPKGPVSRILPKASPMGAGPAAKMPRPAPRRTK